MIALLVGWWRTFQAMLSEHCNPRDFRLRRVFRQSRRSRLAGVYLSGHSTTRKKKGYRHHIKDVRMQMLYPISSENAARPPKSKLVLYHRRFFVRLSGGADSLSRYCCENRGGQVLIQSHFKHITMRSQVQN